VRRSLPTLQRRTGHTIKVNKHAALIADVVVTME